MISFFVKHLSTYLITLIGILLLTFLLLHVLPGGPFDAERALPAEIKTQLYQKYGLHEKGNDSFFVWVLKDLKSYTLYLAHGELGPSLKYKDRDVGKIILKAMGPSLQLGFAALILSLILGIILGLIMVGTQNAWLGKTISWFNTLGLSTPSFITGITLILIFSIFLRWLPPALWEGWRFFILPALTLSLGPVAMMAELTAASLKEELKKDYLRTALAKGLTPKKIIAKHALKNAAFPMLTFIGPLAAHFITGSFIVETMFAIPGLGRHFVASVIDRDMFLVMGLTLTFAVILMTMNFLVDVGYGFLDPRVKKT